MEMVSEFKHLGAVLWKHDEIGGESLYEAELKVPCRSWKEKMCL